MGIDVKNRVNFDFIDEQVTVSWRPLELVEEGSVEIEGLQPNNMYFVSRDLNGANVLAIDGEFVRVVIRAKPGFLQMLYEELQKWKEAEEACAALKERGEIG